MEAAPRRKPRRSQVASCLLAAVLWPVLASASRWMPPLEPPVGQPPAVDRAELEGSTAHLVVLGERGQALMAALALVDAADRERAISASRFRLFAEPGSLSRPLELALAGVLATEPGASWSHEGVWDAGRAGEGAWLPSWILTATPDAPICDPRVSGYNPRQATWATETQLRQPPACEDLYAFVAWGPHGATDPMGLARGFWNRMRKLKEIPERLERERKLEATLEIWRAVRRADVVGRAEDGLATVGGIKVQVPRGAKLGEIFRYRSASGVIYEVPVSEEGWADFSKYAIHRLEKFHMSGDSGVDIDRAKKIYFETTGKQTPVDYTWHHHPDAETMELIPSELNKMTHTGGDAIVNAALAEARKADAGFLNTVWKDVAVTTGFVWSALAPETSAAQEEGAGVADQVVSLGVDAAKMTAVGIPEQIEDVSQTAGQSLWDWIQSWDVWKVREANSGKDRLNELEEPGE